VVENGSGRESGLEKFESSFFLFSEDKRDVLLCEAGERNDNVGEIINEVAVKISKAKE